MVIFWLDGNSGISIQQEQSPRLPVLGTLSAFSYSQKVDDLNLRRLPREAPALSKRTRDDLPTTAPPLPALRRRAICPGSRLPPFSVVGRLLPLKGDSIASLNTRSRLPFSSLRSALLSNNLCSDRSLFVLPLLQRLRSLQLRQPSVDTLCFQTISISIFRIFCAHPPSTGFLNHFAHCYQTASFLSSSERGQHRQKGILRIVRSRSPPSFRLRHIRTAVIHTSSFASFPPL